MKKIEQPIQKTMYINKNCDIIKENTILTDEVLSITFDFIKRNLKNTKKFIIHNNEYKITVEKL